MPMSMVRRFPLSCVRLLPSEFRKAQDAGERYLLSLDVERLLAPFRREAGIAQPLDATGKPARPYPNWESTGLDGHIAGHYLSACVAYAQIADSESFLNRADYVVRTMHECQLRFDSDPVMAGYVGGVPDSKTVFGRLASGDVKAQAFDLNGAWVPLYNLHKTFAGLLDAWQDLADLDEECSELARETVLRLADWWCRITDPLDDDAFARMLESEFGGLCESFAELAARTGSDAYHKMAIRLEDASIFAPLSRGEDHLTGMHANTQIPKVLGWQRLSQLDNNSDNGRACVAAVRTFWNSVVHHRSVSIGAHSVSEHFHDVNDFSSMITSRQGPETCNSYNMSKLAERLWLDDPQPEYLDFYERVVGNHLLSSVNTKEGSEPGFVYFTPMRSRHYRVYSQAQQCFWCCVGSGLENHARYGRLIYSERTAHGGEPELMVNLFAASKLDWRERGIRITQQVSDEGALRVVELQVDSDRPLRLRCDIRNPWWSDGLELTHCDNASAKTLGSQLDGYRSWLIEGQGSAALRFALKPHLSVEPMPDGSPWVSYLYGPTVLAWCNGDDDLEGLFADDSRMGHIASGPLKPLADMPVVIGDALSAVVVGTKNNADAMNVGLHACMPDGSEHVLPLEPFAQIHESRYTVYFPVADRDDVDEMRQRFARMDDEEFARENRRCDGVDCGQQQSEVDHQYQGDGDAMGHDDDIHWRRAITGGSFSYVMQGGGARSLEVSLLGDTSDLPYEVLLDGRNVQRSERRTLVGSSLCVDVFAFEKPVKEGQHYVKIVAGQSCDSPKVHGLTLLR